jgi:hypothetical protein
MPKLTAKQTKVIDEAKEVSTTFEAWPSGKYVGVLREVEERTGKESGNPYWVAEFEDFVDLDGEKYPGRQWYNVMLPITKMPKDYLPKKMRDKGLAVSDLDAEQLEEREAAWENYQGMVAARLKEFFGAFGYTTNSDTDEMLGDSCIVVIGQQTQQMGKNKGKIVNTVDGVEPLSSVGMDEDDDSGSQDF